MTGSVHPPSGRRTERELVLMRINAEQRELIAQLKTALAAAIRELEWFAPTRAPMPFMRAAHSATDYGDVA